MSISAQDVMKLRQMTNVSMMACKKALEETNGDFDQAIDLLRKSGEAKAAKRADRETHEGQIRILSEGSTVAVGALLCETDFVARNDDFMAIVDKLTKAILQDGIETAKEQVAADINELVVKIGEKIEVGNCARIEGTVMGTYLHSNNKLAAVVVLEGGDQDLAKKIAMHVAASPVKCLSPDEVSAEDVAKEKEIWQEQLKNEGKPENIVANILAGKEKKYREENALLTQFFVADPSQTVAQFLGSAKILSYQKIEI